MDIYDFAMKMERNGEEFYHQLADKTENAGLRKILGMLADAEVRHYKLFANMKAHETIELRHVAELGYVRNIFEIMKEEKSFKVNVAEIDLYRKAQDLERQTRDFYLSEAKKAGQPQSKILEKVADEEHRHYLILEDIISMVNRPKTWLENPEWYHQDAY